LRAHRYEMRSKSALLRALTLHLARPAARAPNDDPTQERIDIPLLKMRKAKPRNLPLASQTCTASRAGRRLRGPTAFAAAFDRTPPLGVRSPQSAVLQRRLRRSSRRKDRGTKGVRLRRMTDRTRPDLMATACDSHARWRPAQSTTHHPSIALCG
jgi:hypothetical protein